MRGIISRLLMGIGSLFAGGGFIVMLIQAQLNKSTYMLEQQGLAPVSLPTSGIWTGCGVMIVGLFILIMGLQLWPNKTES